MAVPALRIPVSVSMDQFEQQMGKMGNLTNTVVRKMTTEFIKLNAQIAVEGVKALALFGVQVAKVSVQMGALQALSRTALRLSIPIAGVLAIIETFKAMAAILDLAKEKIEEFNAIQAKASAAGVSNEFFQRWVKGGEQLKLSIDDATAALQRFADTAKDKLGGGDLTKRVNELREAGNLQGNTGVGAFGAAVGNEDKLRAIVGLIDQAMNKGERLAALDLAEKAFGSKVADNLRADAGYLDKILETAQRIKATEIIDQDQINKAVDLKNRLEEAQKILADKFKPIQKDLTKLGMEYQEGWVNFYQNLASAVSYAQQLYDALKGIPEVLANAGRSPFWIRFTEWMKARGLTSELPEEMRLTPTTVLSPAQQALASGLKNPAAVQEAMRQATEIQTRIRGDVSKPPSGPAARTASDFDRTTKSIEKHTVAMEAEAATTGESAFAQEEYRVQLLLTNAAEEDGLEWTKKLNDEIAVTAERAARAKQALAENQFALQRLNSASQQVGSALSTAFADAIVEGKSLNDVMKSLITTLEKAAINSLVMSFFTPGAGGTTSMFGSLFKAAGGTNFAPGGLALVGESGPELVNLPRGSQVIPNDVSRQVMGGGGAITYSPMIDARGASVEAVARLAQILEQDRASFATRTVLTIQQARRGRVPGL
jgi:hypothetical protein